MTTAPLTSDTHIIFDSVQPFFPANAAPIEHCLLIPILKEEGCVEVNVMYSNGEVSEACEAPTVEEAIALAKSQIQSWLDKVAAEAEAA